MRILASVLLVSALSVPCLGAEPLPPGKPAGVHPAISQTTELYVMALAGLVAIGMGVMLFSGSSTTGTAS